MKSDVANYHANLGKFIIHVYKIVLQYTLYLRIIISAHIGVIYHFLKDSRRAEDYYRYALRLDPALEVARDNLQRLHSNFKIN